jgi:serine/threonine protein kinase
VSEWVLEVLCWEGGEKGAVMKKVGKYEVGRTVGEGTFAKVKFAINTETGDCVALKVLAKDTVLRNRMVEQVSTS